MTKIEEVLAFFLPSKQIDGNDKNTQNEQITKNARTETCLPAAFFAYSCKHWGHVNILSCREKI